MVSDPLASELGWNPAPSLRTTSLQPSFFISLEGGAQRRLPPAQVTEAPTAALFRSPPSCVLSSIPVPLPIPVLSRPCPLSLILEGGGWSCAMVAGRLGGGGCWGAQAPPMDLHMQAHFDGLQTWLEPLFSAITRLQAPSPAPPPTICVVRQLRLQSQTCAVN
jgi:hypothetical protein